MTLGDNLEYQILINVKSGSKQIERNLDSEELEHLTHNLRDDLIELESVKSVDFIKLDMDGETEKLRDIFKPKGDAITLGSLLVTCTLAVTCVYSNLANALISWLSRHENQKISIEIGGDKLEVTGFSDEEKQRLIDVWISSHIKKMNMNKNGNQK